MQCVATDMMRDDWAPIFAARGLDLVAARAGLAAAVALLTRWRPDQGSARQHLNGLRDMGWHGPVMLIVADGQSEAVARAIDAGADDAVLASACPDQVAARIAALLRRSGAMLQLGPLCIDRLRREVSRDGERLDLLPREYDLLVLLAQHAGQCVSRAELLARVWNLNFDPGTNVVEVHVSRLRAKLDRCHAVPMLFTERGRGYRLDPP